MSKKKSTDYSSADSGGWMHACDSLFLSQFRGRPCEICGKTSEIYANRQTRSMGHHVLSKELHRLYRFDIHNIITLCPGHHLGAEMSPHSHDGVAQAAFYEWLRVYQEEKYNLMNHRRYDKFNKEWTYREMYTLLGGETHSKSGKLKDLKPYRHSANVARVEGE